MEIQRPRSALHAGNFDEDVHKWPKDRSREERQPLVDNAGVNVVSVNALGTSPTTPWFGPSSPSIAGGLGYNLFRERDYRTHDEERLGRSPVHSVGSYSSSSFVLKAPTTPLIHTSVNPDLETSRRDRSTSPDKKSRRHTLPPHALQSLRDISNTPHSRHVNGNWHSLQRETPFIRAYDPRRSWTPSASIPASTSPPTPFLNRSRRTSFSSEASPLQHASMVGSYEESILRGRMSTAPSLPLDFTAQIGVLGKGDCKPKCPPHITVPFPAVYYSWNAGQGRRPANDEPSPYVGQIDLQQRLPANSVETARQGNGEVMLEENKSPGASSNGSFYTPIELPVHDYKTKRRRRATPHPEPPNGSYRIPQQGQLQIIIKNPNKTAVKLFLVPYDLNGMEPGTKTFIRQRLLSAGPIIESPLLSKPGSRLSNHLDANSKHTLRYLIHLHICCPSKGRFYLYHQIRVVFANRVPDNKEQLRTEIQVPEPRFSVWNPNSLSRQPSGAGAKLAAEKAFRRRSSGFGYGEDTKAPWASNPSGFSGGSTFPFLPDSAPPVPPIPFTLPSRDHKNDGDGRSTEPMDLDSSRPTTSSDLQSPENDKTICRGCVPLSGSMPGASSPVSGGEYEKLTRGDLGYGGFFGRPSTPEPGEGLLARKLRGLGAQREQGGPDIEM